MVQETRLDLSRLAAFIGLAIGLMAGSMTVADAQPLIQNPGLTSLLQPQRLDRSRPLVPQDRLSGTRSGTQPGGASGATPCDRRGSAALGGFPASPSLYGGGSGPGDYGRFVPGAVPPTDPAAQKPGSAAAQPGPTRTATADRPLYGGVDRPLWDTGERRAATATGTSPGKSASPGGAGTAESDAVSRQPTTLPAQVRDRPLWAQAGSTNPDASPSDPGSDSAASAGVGSTSVGPCTSAPLLPR